jgi:hypothetical protein
MTARVSAPDGQAVIEMAIVLVLFSILLMAMLVIGVVGDLAIKTTHGARFSAFDCDSRPGNCRQSSRQSESKIRSTVILSAQREVLPGDTVASTDWRSLHQSRRVITDATDIRLEIDTPRVDGADKTLLAKLASTFRSFSLKAGPAIFDLENPDHLVRSTVRLTLWSSSPQRPSLITPPLQISSRIAMVSDAWAAVDRSDLIARVQRGESPSSLLNSAVTALYFPAKDLLMPLFDLVGLERDTNQFRDQFHKVDHDQVFSNSRITGGIQ